jgi:transposase InsO family protein
MEGKVKRRYVNLTQKGSFSGAHGFRKVVSSGLSRKKLSSVLKTIPAYYLHLPLRKKIKTRRVFASKINEQWVIDLADIQKLARFNYGKRYILCAVDVLSKKAYIVAIPNKSGKVVAKALEEILERADGIPDKIQSDRGTEFYNSFMKKLLKKYGIKLFSVHSAKKAVLIERFIRTLFGKISRYLTKMKTRRFVHKLRYFERLYNKSYHRSIKMSPQEVTTENESEVRRNLYAYDVPPMYKEPSFKVGDACLVAKRKKTFEKGYGQNYINEVFFIHSIIK